jgi:type I restriction enzyme, S subunit
MIPDTLAKHFDLLADAPIGVQKLRELILQLAVQGNLVPQDSNDEPASELVKRIEVERKLLIDSGEIRDPKNESSLGTSVFSFDLPHNWSWVKLGRVMRKMGAGSTPLGGKKVYVSDGIMFLRSQNVWNKGLILDDVARITPEIHSQMSGTFVQPGDVLLNITGASIGRCAVVPDSFEDANVSQHVAILRLIDKDLRHFLHLCVISPIFQDAIMRIQVGVSREGLAMSRLREFPFPIPPLAEQRRIVAKVDELMALCDELEERQRERKETRGRLCTASHAALTAAPDPRQFARHWQRICDHFHLLYDTPQTLPALRQSILNLAVRGRLVPQDPNDEDGDAIVARLAKAKPTHPVDDETGSAAMRPVKEQETPFLLPASWTWARLGTVAGIKHGFAFQSESFTSEPTPFVLTTPGNFYEKGGFRDRGPKTKYYRGSVPSEFVLQPRDLIIPMTEQAPGLLGSPAFIPDDCKTYLHNQRLGKLLFHSDSIAPEFAFWFFNTPFFRGELAKTCTGMKVRHTSPRRILTVPFPICALAEQCRIVAKVDQLMTLCDELEKQLTRSEIESERLMDAFVHDLLNGNKSAPSNAA